MSRFLLALCLAVALADAAAQPLRRGDAGRQDGGRQMSREDRQRMREDMRDAYRGRQDRDREQRPRQMTPEQRDKLRQDIHDANRNLKR
jgi:hypothetical protein